MLNGYPDMKKKVFCLILTAVSLVYCSCSGTENFSGIYEKTDGDCRSRFIELKKMQGFGSRYYLVIIYEKNINGSKGQEFLGVIRENEIRVKSGQIILEGRGLKVFSGNKKCSYKKK